MNLRKTFYLLLPALSALYCCNSLFAQNACSTSTFINHYRFKGEGTCDFTVFSPDNSILLGGRLDKQVTIFRVRENGDTVWAKKINFPTWANMGLAIPPSASIADQQHTYVTAYRNIFVRIDSGGRVLSGKRIIAKDTLAIVNMIMAPDGDKILLLESGGWGKSAFLVRVSSNLSEVRWVKNIEPNTMFNFIKIRKISLAGNKIGCVGIHDANGSQAMILAFDYNTGQLLHSKSVQIENKTVYPFDIQAYDSGFIVQGAIQGAGEDGFAILKLDHHFNIKNVHLFKGVDRFNSIVSYVQKDGGFYWMSNYAGVTFLVHVNTNNFMDSQTSFVLFNTGSNRGISMKETGSHLFFTISAGVADPGINNPATIIGLYKSNLNGYIGDCNVPSSRIRYEPIAFTNLNLPIINVKNDSIQWADIVLDIEPLPSRIEKLCSAVSTCTTLKIIGDTTTCSNQVKLISRKNTLCRLPVKWTAIQGSSPITQSSLNDSVAIINFTQSGDYKIEVSLTGSCAYIADTILVHVSLPGMLNLGKDTALCTGDSLKLSLAGSYKSVSWQDGSTGNGLTITQPGTYYVQAEAACGGILRDTIVVTQRSSTPINIGADRIKCNNDTVHITAPAGFINYNWSPAYNTSSITTPSIIVNPAVDTSYIVKAQNSNGCFSYDTIKIKVSKSAPVFLGNDTSLCAGASMVLNAGNGFASYKWSNGSTGKQIIVTTPGSYFVRATSTEGCYSDDTIKVVVHPLLVVNLDKNTGLCSGSTRLLDAGKHKTYAWHDGSTSQTFLATGKGRFYVKVTDVNGCNGSDTVDITTIKSLPSNFLPADTAICAFASVPVQSKKTFSAYMWNTNETTRSIIISKQGKYWLKVKDDNGCIGTDSISISVNQCAIGLFVPSAFTPNNDGKNDKLKAFISGDIKKFEFSVYNRLGQLMFKTNNPSDGWTGKLNGIEQNAGTFIWICTYQLANEPVKTEKGTILLMR